MSKESLKGEKEKNRILLASRRKKNKEHSFN
jgi:hypothetical protein